MKRILIKETWISEYMREISATDNGYYPQWIHIVDSHTMGCVTTFMKTIESIHKQ